MTKHKHRPPRWGWPHWVKVLPVSLATTAVFLWTRHWPYALIAFVITLAVIWLLEDAFEKRNAS